MILNKKCVKDTCVCVRVCVRGGGGGSRFRFVGEFAGLQVFSQLTKQPTKFVKDLGPSWPTYGGQQHRNNDNSINNSKNNSNVQYDCLFQDAFCCYNIIFPFNNSSSIKFRQFTSNIPINFFPIVFTCFSFTDKIDRHSSGQVIPIPDDRKEMSSSVFWNYYPAIV